jgi:hypothetical protein
MWESCCTGFLRSQKMPAEEYRKRASEARKLAAECGCEFERRSLLAIADQFERIADYQNLVAFSALPAAAAGADEAATTSRWPASQAA